LHAYVIWKGNRSWDRVLVDLIEPCSFAPDIELDVHRKSPAKRAGLGSLGMR
jgi:hypothetical protein